MRKETGKSVYKGIALGTIHVLKKNDYSVRREIIEDTDAEIQRVKAATQKAGEELQALYEKALKEVGESNAAIFQVHQMMLEDEDYLDSIENIICTQKVNAEYATTVTGENFAEMFASMDDEYMQARSADIKDITERIVKCLCGGGNDGSSFDKPVIIVADDLAPSETVSLDKEKILAFVTVHGSTNSHTAILARTMNIPALIGVDIDIENLQTGTEALVNGFTSEFILEPTEELKAEARIEMEKEAKKRELLQSLTGKETITLGGKKVNLYANVGSIGDLAYALENDAEGVGLFRSEFLYIGRDCLPTEEEQFNIYKQAALNMAGKKVIIRTLDIGADKQADYLNLPPEENPALGYRAIRICLTNPDIFKTQLRALYRAAVYGNISIMYPMIISTDEVKAIKKISQLVKAELAAEDIPYKDVEEGIMIETPAAVMISDELAEMVDFFSIGTNDLTQYTLAIDRQNEKLDTFYNAHHPAVLKMIQTVVENAHKAGKWAGICGELGADTELTETFVRMGIDELSVAPGAILGIRKIIRELD
ncbi:MAG: phosphoenolpyruvate--protein phosphotransferase [Lachnospiraceae bacterium]|nr:phosphoenolpyruvate--protein phosphotransferase [Lachnospiraceae bacterium]